MTLRTPHWTRSALRATIAIPSLRSLRGVRVPLGVPAESIFGGVVSGARKHLIKGAFFLPCFGTRTPRALRAFGAAEMTLRTPHWTRSALRAAIAIPSLRSLRGFESLSGSPPKAFSVGLFQAPENTSSRGVFSRPVWGPDPRALCALSAQPK